MPLVYNPQTGSLDITNTGNVVGPSSSVDLAAVRYSGTTGKLLLGPKRMQVYEEMDDYVIGDATSNRSFPNASSGAGASVAAVTNNALLTGHPGIMILRTGTDSNGYAFSYHGANTIAFNTGETYIAEADIYIPVALSDVVDTYVIYSGFNDTILGAANDGAYFQYDISVNATKFSAVTANNGTRTTQDTGVVVATGTWYKLSVVHNGTNAAFYINDALTNTISTNLPSGGVRATSYDVTMMKTLGNTSRDLYVDYTYYSHNVPNR